MKRFATSLLAALAMALGMGCGGEAAKTTKKQSGQPCMTTKDCAEGLTCYLRRCASPKKKGAVCTSYDFCAKGLVCHADKCVFPRAKGAACTAADRCQKGLVCRNKRCVSIRRYGKSCSLVDICAKGLLCRYGKCTVPSKSGARCDTPRHCKVGLRCLFSECMTPAAIAAEAKTIPKALAVWKKVDKICKGLLKKYPGSEKYLVAPQPKWAEGGPGVAVPRKLRPKLDAGIRKAQKVAAQNRQYVFAASSAFIKYKLAELKRKKAKPRKINRRPVRDLNVCAVGFNEQVKAELQALLPKKSSR